MKLRAIKKKKKNFFSNSEIHSVELAASNEKTYYPGEEEIKTTEAMATLCLLSTTLHSIHKGTRCAPTLYAPTLQLILNES